MRLDLQIQNLESVSKALAKLSGPQAKAAYSKAINDTGFMVRKAMQTEFGKFDRVTPFIQKSPKLIAATPDRLSASILPTLDSRNLPSTGGKIGVDPQDVLQAQEFGGQRRDKRSESALRRAGFLPVGMQTVIPAQPFPGSDDGRGNLRGTFLQQLLSYLQAYSESGFKANATDKRRRSINRGTSKTQGRRYFVAGGRSVTALEGGDRLVTRRVGAKPTAHLSPGIWAAIAGGQIKPVLMFVRNPTYTPLISMARIAQQSGAQDHLDKRVRFRVRELAESA